MSWTAVVLAGSRPGTDPFARAHGAELKALIPVAGTPMVARPVASLLATPCIASVVVLAQDVSRIASVLPADKRLETRSSAATIAASLDALLADPATGFPLLVTTADHALLDRQMVEEFCARADGADVAIGLVERRALMKRLPASRRTWLAFRGGAYSGANLFAFGNARAGEAVALWRSVEQDRKKGWRMVAALGLAPLLGALLRLRTLEQTLQSAGRRLGLGIRMVELSNPLAAVDVDKESDHALVTAILEGRA